MRLFGRLAGRSMLALASLAALGLGWLTWGGPVKRELAECDEVGREPRCRCGCRVRKARLGTRARNWLAPCSKIEADNPDALRIFARASARMEHDTTAAAIYSGRLGSSLIGVGRLFC